MAEPPRVLVIGATSAIAQAVARIYAARGSRLYLVARDASKLEAVRADLAARGAAQADAIVADLARIERHGQIVDDAATALAGIDVALIAHGVLPEQARAQSSFAEAQRALEVNFTSPASLAHEIANRFETRGRGTLAVIGSVAGDRGRQSNYVYGAAKGGLAIFLQGLRHRLHRSGVKILTVKPGFVDTPMTAGFPKGPLWASPERVARGIVAAIDRGTSGEIYVPGFWRAIMALIRALPERVFVKTKL
ncbi:MAG TPA: SDR family oxidoreductase [Usitatibacter sp.]|jgi:short-subunit dehydrogenase|nr:SDR family oxidoreductase [Usitatibacter sp.]